MTRDQELAIMMEAGKLEMLLLQMTEDARALKMMIDMPAKHLDARVVVVVDDLARIAEAVRSIECMHMGTK